MKLVTDEKTRLKVLRKELKEEGGWNLESWVRCIHCGRPFQGEEMRVFEDDGEYLIFCKFPKCPGSIIDIVDEDDDDFI